MAKVVLWINMSDSKCGACNLGCNPYEKSHESRYGYNVTPEDKGCGAMYTHVASGYSHIQDRVFAMRPDLEPLEWGNTMMQEKVDFSSDRTGD